VIVGNGADLAARRARVSPSGQCVSLQRWFLSKILLDRDVTMEPVVGTKFIVYIGRALINVHGCACRGKNSAMGVPVGDIPMALDAGMSATSAWTAASPFVMAFDDRHPITLGR